MKERRSRGYVPLLAGSADDEQPFFVTNHMTGQTYSIAYCGEGDADDDLEVFLMQLITYGYDKDIQQPFFARNHIGEGSSRNYHISQ